MIVRALFRLLAYLVFSLLAYFVIRLLGTMRLPGHPSGDRAVVPGPGESMVRDRVCNTFLPRSSALLLRQGMEEHFFCSEACRSSFLEGQGSGPAASAARS